MTLPFPSQASTPRQPEDVSSKTSDLPRTRRTSTVLLQRNLELSGFEADTLKLSHHGPLKKLKETKFSLPLDPLPQKLFLLLAVGISSS
ncbi:hypothetical protein AVEN_73151-1 [Araneus ventricosus]|uniref:Uncharacterized protein n=1 Tax=Araneus ventricosus TaxID=182803 RepID=A0A4Y2J0A8_ARAVE|nr:hypothetical protein AVEN_73151-1 [Araneus ventricosus]